MLTHSPIKTRHRAPSINPMNNSRTYNNSFTSFFFLLLLSSLFIFHHLSFSLMQHSVLRQRRRFFFCSLFASWARSIHILCLPHCYWVRWWSVSHPRGNYYKRKMPSAKVIFFFRLFFFYSSDGCVVYPSSEHTVGLRAGIKHTSAERENYRCTKFSLESFMD